MPKNTILNVVKELRKIWAENKLNDAVTKIPENELKGYLSSDYAAMIIPLTYRFRDAIKGLFVEMEEKDVPNLDFKAEKGEKIKAKYSTEYLKVVLEMTKYYESVTFEMKKDYPLRVTCDDFIFIFAPRVD